MGNELYYSLRTQIKKDHTPARAQYFRVLLAHRPLPRALYALAGACPPGVRSLCCLVYAALVSAKRLPRHDRLALVKHPNEKGRLRTLEPVLNEYAIQVVEWSNRFSCLLFSLSFFSLRLLRHPKQSKKIWRTIRRANRKYPLYVSLRVAEALFTYVYLRERLSAPRARLLLCSTDGNPHGIALMGVASALRIPCVFASHGVTAETPVRLAARLALFFGERSKREYESLRTGTDRETTFLLYGYRQLRRPLRLPPRPRAIGLFLSRDPDAVAIEAAIHEWSTIFPETIFLLRPHPNSLVPWARSLGNTSVANSGRTLSRDLEGCDLVLAGNSTVHLECLLEGVATVFCPALDLSRLEPLGFLREVVCPFTREWEEVREFYSQPGWPERLADFLNVKESQEDFLRALRRVIRQLLE